MADNTLTEEEQDMALVMGNDLSSHLGSGSGSVRVAKTGRLLSAQELREKYGWKPVATEERMENLRSNLEFFV